MLSSNFHNILLQYCGKDHSAFICHCVKSVCIRSYSGPHFPAFGLSTDRYSVSHHIQSEYGKMRTIISPNTDTFHAVCIGEAEQIIG